MIRILYFSLLVLSISSIVITLTACQTVHNDSHLAEHSPKYLKAKLTRLLELARSPQTEPQLKRELTKSILNAQQVHELLREHPLRQKLGQVYERVIAKNAQQELLWTLQECAKLGYSRLEISRVGPQAGASNAHGDLALLELLKSRDGLYTVRLKRNESDLQALRMSGWLYDQDLGWVTLLKLGEEILHQSKRKQNDE
ncbi:MAG: hypothetical protein CMH49_08405 [Myxococcales bacterium]|nr:hypothetical protein [Myxococcales bacterium]